MRVLIDLVGGPLDGMSKPLSDPPQLVWAAKDTRNRLRLYRHAAPGRLPYEAMADDEPRPRTSYVFGGHHHFVCAHCGIYHALRDGAGDLVAQCDLCEHPAPSVVVRRAA